jgi:hypothetical protein
MRTLIFSIFLLSLSCIITQCAGPTKMTTPGLGYTAGDYTKQKYKHVLVLSRVKDPIVRQKMENALADLLNRSGIKATASHKIVNAEDMTSQEKFIAKIENLGIDGLIAYTFYGTTQTQANDVATINGAPVTSIGIFNVFLSPSYSFDLNTQLNSSSRVRTELYNRSSKDVRWYRVVEVEMNNGVDIGCDQLAGRTLMVMKQDGIL